MNKKLLFLAGLAPLVAAPALVVASCSSSTTTDGTTGMTPEEAQAAKDAMNRAKAYLESKSYFFADKKPSELKLEEVALPALKPSQNLGFSTKYFDKDFKDNDETGEKSIRIQVSRGKIKLADQYAVLKLKSTKDDETDEKTNVDQLLNLDPVKGISGKDSNQKTTVRRATIFVKDYDNQDQAPKASEIKKFIDNFETERLNLFLKSETEDKVFAKEDPKVQIGWKSLVKPSAAKKLDVKNFIFDNARVRQTKVGSIEAPSITFDLRLQSDDKSKTSAPVEVNLVGFRLDADYKNQVGELFKQATTEFGALYNPIIDDNKTKDVLADSVTLDNLESYLFADWNKFGGDLIVPIEIQSSVVDIISSNDSEGSLKVKFKFERIGEGASTTPLSVEKEITLFGFQVVQAQ